MDDEDEVLSKSSNPPRAVKDLTPEFAATPSPGSVHSVGPRPAGGGGATGGGLMKAANPYPLHTAQGGEVSIQRMPNPHMGPGMYNC